MEKLTSRKNQIITHLRALGVDRAFRHASGEFLCDGRKLLQEALQWGADVTAVLWSESAAALTEIPAPQYVAPPELLDYVSPLKKASEVVFSVRIPQYLPAAPGRTLVLESIQDPGNLGTILRTANAFDMDTVILTGECADVFNPKTVRATMGAVFRQRFYVMEHQTMRAYLTAHGLRLYGAALSEASVSIREISLADAAVAIGSEGRGLSPELLALCDGQLIIPMNARCESLNAAIAAAIVMWELTRC